MPNCKNYKADGGDKLVIGGVLEFTPDAVITGLMENTPASTASTVAGIVADFNDLLEKLKAAGLMAADE